MNAGRGAILDLAALVPPSLAPSCAASMRTEGSIAPSAYRPSMIAAAIMSRSLRYTGLAVLLMQVVRRLAASVP